jgi:hypothetical protein
MRMGQLTAAAALAVEVCACAAPTFRNAAYLVDQSAPLQVVEPNGYLPPKKSSFYQLAGYQYPPSSIVIPTVNEPPNPFFSSAGLLVDNTGKDCLQDAFPLRRAALRGSRPPVNVVYQFGGAVGLPFANAIAVQQFRTQRKLVEIPDDVIGYIRQVEFHIGNIRSYEGSKEQTSSALKSLGAERGCGAIDSPGSAIFIRKVYVGNVKTYVRFDAAFSSPLFNAWKSKVQKSLRESFEGTDVIFAVETQPLGTILR